MKAKELIALLSMLNPETEIRTLVCPKYGASYIEDVHRIEKCVIENTRSGDETVDAIISLSGSIDKMVGDLYPIDTPDEDVRSWSDDVNKENQNNTSDVEWMYEEN